MLKRILAIAFSLMVLIGVFSFTTQASENTTYTYTISVDDEWIRTRTGIRERRICETWKKCTTYLCNEYFGKKYGGSRDSDTKIDAFF